MFASRSVLIAVPIEATFASPLQLAFRKLGFNTYLFDYRNVFGNFSFNPIFTFMLIPVAILKISLHHFPDKFSVLNELLYITCVFWKPTYLFAVKGEHITKTTIMRIKKLGIFTIVWQVDPSLDPRIWSFVDKHQRAYDVYISCEPGTVITELKRRGFKQVLYMLGAADSEQMHQSHEKEKYDITLVGTYHPERERFLQALEGLDVHIWGWGDWHNSDVANMFEGGSLTNKNMLEVYKQSKIVVNIGRAIGSTIPTNLRPFEAAQVGAFILVDYKPNLKKVFVLGKEIDTFKTPKELREKVDFYLKNPDKRSKIAQALFKRVKKEHTYQKRLQTLFQQIEFLKSH